MQTARRVASPSGRQAPRLPLWVTGVIVACCAIEALLVILSLGPMPDARARAMAYGAFWAPLIFGAPPVFPGQPVTMFFSYGLLHAGVVHLAMNMVSLAAVARELARLMTPLRMALTYLVSQIVAALVFGLMARDAVPMVGASGAIFGLAGALIGMAARSRLRRGQPLGPLWRAVGIILVLNLGLTLAMPGIAWQAHLGGALAGLLIGLILPPGRRK